jgi:hypothetical protein
MKTIIIKDQAHWDSQPKRFDELTALEIREGFLVIKSVPENSSAVLWGNSSAELRGNSRAELWENSRAELWGNSSAVLWGNSSAELRGSSGCHCYDYSIATLFAFSVAWAFGKSKTQKKAKTATIIKHVEKQVGSAKDWLDKEGVSVRGATAIIFKRVSGDFKTQEKTANETLWAVGSKVTHHNWIPNEKECGEGKFHACSRPYFCDEFRSNEGDKYVAIRVKVADMKAWPGAMYPHKIAFRSGVVLYECDRFGEKINAANT